MKNSLSFEPQDNSMVGPKQRFLDSTDHLPKTFDVKAMKQKREPDVKNCMLCEADFIKLFNKNPIRHCKRCAKAVCKGCSDNKK